MTDAERINRMIDQACAGSFWRGFLWGAGLTAVSGLLIWWIVR